MRGMTWLTGCLALIVAFGSAARADEPAGCPACFEGGCPKCEGKCDARCEAQCSDKCCAGDYQEAADDSTSCPVAAVLWAVHHVMPASESVAYKNHTAKKGAPVRMIGAEERDDVPATLKKRESHNGDMGWDLSEREIPDMTALPTDPVVLATEKEKHELAELRERLGGSVLKHTSFEESNADSVADEVPQGKSKAKADAPPVGATVQSLREMAASLDGVANQLESAGRYSQADRLRNQAQQLRTECRELLATPYQIAE